MNLNIAAHGRFVDYLAEKKKAGSIEFWMQGSLIQVHGGVSPPDTSNEYEKKVSRQRGCVGDFNAKCRLRMMTFCAKLCTDDTLPLFVTLTYPGFLTPELRTPKKWKRDLDAFKRWMSRNYPDAYAVWKLEPQRCRVCKPDRKLKTLCTCGAKLFAPHYHLMVWGIGFLPHMELAKAWYKIVGSGQEDHLLAGIQVKRARTRNGVMCYAGKIYMGKECCTFGGMVGRWWGVIGRKNIKFSVCEKIELKADCTKLVRRVARKWLERKGIRAARSQVLNIYTRDFLTWIKVGEWAVEEIQNRILSDPRRRPF